MSGGRCTATVTGKHRSPQREAECPACGSAKNTSRKPLPPLTASATPATTSQGYGAPPLGFESRDEFVRSLATMRRLSYVLGKFDDGYVDDRRARLLSNIPENSVQSDLVHSRLMPLDRMRSISPSMAKRALSDPRLDSELLMFLYRISGQNDSAIEDVLSHPNCPEDFMREAESRAMGDRYRREVLCFSARSDNCPPDMVERFLDEVREVQFNALMVRPLTRTMRSPKIPADTLRSLLDDGELPRYMRWATLANPNLDSDEVVREILANIDDYVSGSNGAASNPSIDEEGQLALIRTGNNDILYDIVDNPSLTGAAMLEIASNEYGEVRSALVERRGPVSREALLKIRSYDDDLTVSAGVREDAPDSIRLKAIAESGMEVHLLNMPDTLSSPRVSKALWSRSKSEGWDKLMMGMAESHLTSPEVLDEIMRSTSINMSIQQAAAKNIALAPETISWICEDEKYMRLMATELADNIATPLPDLVKIRDDNEDPSVGRCLYPYSGEPNAEGLVRHPRRAYWCGEGQ